MKFFLKIKSIAFYSCVPLFVLAEDLMAVHIREDIRKIITKLWKLDIQSQKRSNVKSVVKNIQPIETCSQLSPRFDKMSRFVKLVRNLGSVSLISTHFTYKLVRNELTLLMSPSKADRALGQTSLLTMSSLTFSTYLDPFYLTTDTTLESNYRTSKQNPCPTCGCTCGHTN